MECLEYHLGTRLTRLFHFFLSFTNLMRVWWGIHLGSPQTWPWRLLPGRLDLSCTCLLESKPQAGEGLVSQAWAVEASPGYRGAYGKARSLWLRLGHGLLIGFSPLCWALPVSQQRWVLLLRVVLRALILDSWAWQGCFLMCNTHSCCLLTSSTVWGKTHASVCSLVLCLVTTEIWSDGHYSPLGVSQLSGFG